MINLMKGITTMTKKISDALTGKRDALAQDIRELTKNVALNSIEMGKKLTTAQNTFPTVQGKRGGTPTRPGWDEWVKKETGLTRDMAARLIRIAKNIPARNALRSGASFRVLTILARDTIPPEARKTVTDKLDKGEKVTEAEAKEIISRATSGGITKKEIKKISAFHAENAPPLPKPKEAKKQARENGEFVLASDGYYYSPATEEQIKKNENNLRMTCKVLRAVETLSHMEVTPHQFVDRAIFYMLWVDPKTEPTVREAAKWLDALATTWEMSADKIKQKIADMREAREQDKKASSK